MERRGLNGGTFTTGEGYTAGTFGMIDNMTYNYNDANQLTKIVDASLYNKGYTRSFYDNTRPIDRIYDANGNMITDVGKRITSNIIYNHLNLPMEITIDGNKIKFVYDATGVKLQKRIVPSYGARTEIIYNYVNGVEYKSNSLERIANTEGAVTKNINGAFEYEYALRDHLGNTRVTFRDKDKNGSVQDTDIVQINHYYPFGLNMEGNWTPKGANGEGNKYGYNGKELNEDFGLNWNDYGARFYDAAVGRWNVVDPLSYKYNSHSPYNYTLNNPIKYIDPDGMQVTYDWTEHNAGRKGVYNDDGQKKTWGDVKDGIVASSNISVRVSGSGSNRTLRVTMNMLLVNKSSDKNINMGSKSEDIQKLASKAFDGPSYSTRSVYDKKTGRYASPACAGCDFRLTTNLKSKNGVARKWVCDPLCGIL